MLKTCLEITNNIYSINETNEAGTSSGGFGMMRIRDNNDVTSSGGQDLDSLSRYITTRNSSVLFSRFILKIIHF